MKTYKTLTENLNRKNIILYFCECSLPTLEHLLAFAVTKQLAENKKADYAILLSNTRESTRNPLSISQKLEYTNLLYPGFNLVVASESMNTPVDAARAYSTKYKNITLMCNADYVGQCSSICENSHLYNSINIVSTGEANPETSAASKNLKTAIIEGDLKSLKACLLPHVREIDAKRFMNDARIGMGLDAIRESIVFNTSALREQYIAGEIFAENTFVESNNELYKIINRNNNYITVSNNLGILSKKWLTDVQPVEVSEETRVKFEGITEMKFSTADKIKVGKIIGGMLGADVSKGSNAEQMVNAGLRIIRSKTLNPEAISILQNMLKTADDAGILYDKKLVPNKVVTEDSVQYSADIKNPDFDPIIGKYKRKQHLRRMTFSRDKRVEPDEVLGGRTIESLDIVPSTAGSDVQAPQIDQYVYKTPDLAKRKIKTPVTFRRESADDVISSDNQSPEKLGTVLDVPLSKESRIKKKKNESVDLDEAKRRDPVQEHIDSIRARTEQAHLKGQRYYTLYKQDQHIADEHHKHLNSLGGKQVALPEAVKECTVDEVESSNDGSNITDAEIDDMISHIDNWDDIIGLYDSSELSYVDSITGDHVADVPDKFYGYEGDPEETPDEREIDAPDEVFVAGPPKMRESTELNELMSRVERLKTDIAHHGNRVKREVKVVLKKRSTAAQLHRKARSLAAKTLKLNLAKKPLKQLTHAERLRINQIVASKNKLVNRIALRLLPRIKAIEQLHMTHSNYTKE